MEFSVFFGLFDVSGIIRCCPEDMWYLMNASCCTFLDCKNAKFFDAALHNVNLIKGVLCFNFFVILLH